MFRLSAEILEESNIGFISTTYKFPESDNFTAGIDGRLRFSSNTFASFQGPVTSAERCERSLEKCINDKGFGYNYSISRDTRNWIISLEGSGRTRRYQARVGFTPRVNTNSHNFALRYNSTPKTGSILVSWSTVNSSNVEFDWEARSQNLSNTSQVNLNFTRQTAFTVGFSRGYERIFQEEFGQLFAKNIPERSASNFAYFGSVRSAPSKKFSILAFASYMNGVFDFDFGAEPKFPRVSPIALENSDTALLDPGPGSSINATLNVLVRPTSKITLTIDYTKSRLVRRDTRRIAFNDNIVSLNPIFQLGNSWSIRTRTDVQTINSSILGQYLLAWEPKPNTAIFVGYNNDIRFNNLDLSNSTNRSRFALDNQTFFFKVSYLVLKTF